MELIEEIDVLNKRLVDHFGVAWNGNPIWRIVWSEDQFEKRHGTYDDISPAGVFIRRVTEWRSVPKYRQWIREKYVLERLTIVPEINQTELSEKVSYEPIWVFEDKNQHYLPPKWEAAKMVIDTLLAASGRESMGAKYKDPDVTPQDNLARVQKIEEELFGNETETGDALAHGQAIVVPSNYEKES